MKKSCQILFFVLIGFGLLTVNLNAEISLSSKILYLEKLKKEAVLLEEQGYYDKSIEKSREIQKLAGEVEILIAILKKWYQLERNIAVAKQIGADKAAPEDYKLAVDYYKSAEKAFLDENLEQAESDIDEGLRYSEIAIEKAREFFENDKNNSLGVKHKIELTKMDGKYYVVRLIPKRRDSLWRIAEYDSVYGDPWKWKIIYRANKNIIKDPNLIHPNQKLVIPPLELDLDQ